MNSAPIALRRVQLVAGERQQVDVLQGVAQIDRELAHRLRGIGMKDDRRIGLFGQARQLGDGKDDSRFVVRVHHGDQQRIGRRARMNWLVSRLPSLSTGKKVTS